MIILFILFLLLLFSIIMLINCIFENKEDYKKYKVSNSRIIKCTYNDGSVRYVCQYRDALFIWHNYEEFLVGNSFEKYDNAEKALYNYFEQIKNDYRKKINNKIIKKEKVNKYLPLPEVRKCAELINKHTKKNNK